MWVYWLIEHIGSTFIADKFLWADMDSMALILGAMGVWLNANNLHQVYILTQCSYHLHKIFDLHGKEDLHMNFWLHDLGFVDQLT